MARLSNENLGPVFSKPGRAECARILSDLPGRFSGDESIRGSELYFVVVSVVFEKAALGVRGGNGKWSLTWIPNLPSPSFTGLDI